MDTDSFYFKYIKVDYDPADIERFLEVYPLLRARFDKVDLAQLRTLVPSIMSWFDSKGMEPFIAIAISHDPTYKQQIHKDVMKNSEHERILALNFPLNSQAKNSVTRMYSVIGEDQPHVKMTKEGNKELPYYYYTEDQVQLAGIYMSTSPVLVNVSHPHSAYNCTPYRRGVLSFRFIEDPWFLVDEQ